MSERYPGGFISKNAPTVSTSGAQGVWTLEQQAAYQKAGQWPFGGPFNYIEDVFSTYLYTGNGSNRSITNGIDLAGKGGLVWIKSRSDGVDGYQNIYDSARGVTKVLWVNSTSGQNDYGNQVTSFNSNGFSLGVDSTALAVNKNGATYASWTFRKQPKFFDVVTYTGTGVARTISHSLGSVPGCIIVKRTDTTGDWQVYHRGMPSNGFRILLNSTAAYSFGNYWNYTDPTATEFSVGTNGDINVNGGTYVAYLFAHNAGGFGTAGTDNVISCGSFTTDSTGLATVTLGYEPQWILYKKSATTSDWTILDTMRGMAITASNILAANTSAAEVATANLLTPTATGFVAPSAGFSSNTAYIYIAIRRGPMKTPTSGTSVFSANKSAASAGTQITTNFVVDMQIQGYRPGDSENFAVADRLRGVSSTTTQTILNLKTSSTAAESTTNGSQTRYWNNTGFQQSAYLAGADGIFWNFGRAPNFMDVVCYTGNGVSGRNIDHNLGVAPELVIIKSRNRVDDWVVRSSAFPSGGVNDIAYLNYNIAASGAGYSYSPTATTFQVGNNNNQNGSTYTYVAYLFASCPGVSKVGSYTGTSSNQIINCGFPARFVMIKRTDGTGDWWVWDTTRGMISGDDYRLAINTTGGEPNSNWVLTNASGFQLVDSNVAINTVGGTYIFLAIA